MVLPSSPPVPAGSRWRRLVTLPLRIGPYEGRLERTPFLRLAVLHACSSAGDALVTVALAGSVFVSVSLSAARGRTALGLVCTVLPFVVVGPLLGPRIDRIRGGRRCVAALSCVGRAGACLVMVHVISSLLLFPAAFFSLVCSKTYLVAKASLVPGAVASDDDLVTANSRLAVGSSIVTSIAAVIGAGVYRWVGSGAVLYIDAAVFLAGAVLAGGVRPARPRPLGLRVTAGVGPGRRLDPAPAPTTAGDPSTRRSLPPGGLFAAALAMASMRAMAGLMTALVVFAFRREGAPLIWYGLVAVASVGGNLAGAAIAPPLRARVREERLVLGSALAIGVLALSLIEVSIMHRRPAALVLGAGVGIGASVAKLAFDALVQREVPDARRSRRIAVFETMFQLGWVLAALVPVLVPLSLGYGFAIVATCTLAGAAEFLWGVRQARRGALPRWWPEAQRPAPGAAPAAAGSAATTIADVPVAPGVLPPLPVAGRTVAVRASAVRTGAPPDLGWAAVVPAMPPPAGPHPVTLTGADPGGCGTVQGGAGAGAGATGPQGEVSTEWRSGPGRCAEGTDSPAVPATSGGDDRRRWRRTRSQ